MTPERWAQIEELFHRAAECDPQHRATLLDETCNGDDELRRKIAALLLNEQNAIDDMQAAVRSGFDALTFPLVDETVSHYHILEGLGGGGMGLVYRAVDMKLGRQVALKFLPEESALRSSALKRFEREARSASALAHPNICPIYEFGEHEGKPFLAMQLLEGQTLRELIAAAGLEKPPLEIPKLLDLALQITEALQAAHAHGIIHRDIKPANIFVTIEGQAKILDFGLAKLSYSEPAASESGPEVLDDAGPGVSAHEALSTTTADPPLSRTGMAMGTAGYMSPEQACGENLDARTDLFSFGLVLYEMATGQRVFQGDAATVLQDTILGAQPTRARKLNPKIPAKLEAILDKVLKKDRDARYQSASELAADLKAVLLRAQPESRVFRRLGAFAGILVLALLVALWRWLPSITGKASVMKGKRSMAVIEIANLSQNSSLDWLSDGLVDLITTDLAQAKNLDVISSERVRSLIGTEVKPGDRLPASRARQVAQRAGADVFISGEVLPMGQGFQLDLRVQDTTTGKVLGADKVEGDTPQAIFSMVDRATAHIVSQLSPQALTLQPNAASLTSNLDALRAYEEGLSYLHRGIVFTASASFRRAAEIDHEFAMAYYYLGATTFNSRSREALERAAELAQRQSLPEQQKLLIKAGQLEREGRGEEASQILETIVHLFPKEFDPRVLLADHLKFQGRLSEAALVLEEAPQFNEPDASVIQNALAYTYAYQGDLPRALTAVDKYAASLPPNDPNPIDTRADIYALHGRFDKAIAEYKKNVESHPEFVPELKIALVYLLAGKNREAEEAAQSGYEKANEPETSTDLTNNDLRGVAKNVLGDIALGRGDLDRAAVHFSESAVLLLANFPDLARRESWKAAEIYFEQGKPRSALAWARRTRQLGAEEIAGVAYLLLKNDPAAEREFATARRDLTPFFGDYMAGKMIAMDRMLADGYAAKWHDVIAAWPQFSSTPINSFFPGRAYAGLGMWPQSELELRRPFIWLCPGLLMNSFSDYFRAELTQFYLGEVLEHEGKTADTIEAYNTFLAHFEHSTARLSQIAEARAALRRLK